MNPLFDLIHERILFLSSNYPNVHSYFEDDYKEASVQIGIKLRILLLTRDFAESIQNKNPNSIHTLNEAIERLNSIKDFGRLMAVLSSEEAPLIAVIASYLKPSAAAELMSSISKDKKLDVMKGIATLTHSTFLDALEKRLSERLSDLHFQSGSHDLEKLIPQGYADNFFLKEVPSSLDDIVKNRLRGQMRSSNETLLLRCVI